MDWRPVGRVNFDVSNGYLHKKSSDISLGMQFYSLDKAPNMVKSNLKHSKIQFYSRKEGKVTTEIGESQRFGRPMGALVL